MTDTVDSPYAMIGGRQRVEELTERFYDAMEADEPELAALHRLEDGAIPRAMRDRFALFLVGWLGGPQDYMTLHGHPRLRLRHAHVPISREMRDAWVRCMARALSDLGVAGHLRAFLDQRFSDVASFLINVDAGSEG